MNRKRLHEQKTMSSLGSGWSRNSLHPLPYFLTQVVFHGFQGILFQAADLGLADMNFLCHLGLCFSLKKAHADDVAFPFG